MTFTENFSQFALSKLPSFREDFSTATAWVGGTAGRTEITGGALEFTFENGGDDSIHADQTSVDDERWVLRAKMVLDTVQNPNVGTTHGFIGVSNNILDIADTQNAIGLRINRNDTGASTQFVAISTITNIDASPTNDTLFTTIPTVGTFFIEIKRISKTLVRVTLFSDADYSVLIETQDVTTSPSVNGLQFIKITNRDAVAQTTPAFIGRFDDLEFWDGAQQGDVTLQDDFSIYANQAEADAVWIPTDNTIYRVNTTTDVLQCDSASVLKKEVVHKDLGVALSDTAWVIRFKLKVTNFTQGSSATNLNMFIGMSDNINDSDTLQDFIGLFMEVDSTIRQDYGTHDTLAQTPIGVLPDNTFTHDIQAETIFVEIIRLTATTYSIELFTNADFTGTIESESGTCDAGTNSLRFFKAILASAGAHDHVTDFEIDDIEFYDGVSVAKTPIKELIDFEDNFVVDNWVDADASSGVNTTTQVIDFTYGTDSLNESISFDLGLDTVNDNKWTLRFKMNFTTLTPLENTVMWVGVSDSDSSVSSASSHDALWIKPIHATGTKAWHIDISDGTIPNSGTSSEIDPEDVATGIDYYCELKRISSTLAIASVYNDSDYTQLRFTKTFTIPATITGLRFIKVMSVDLTNIGNMTGIIDDVQFWNGNDATVHRTKWVEVNF